LHYKGVAEKLSEAHEARNLEKLFRLSKTSNSSKKPVEQTCPGMKDHFESHFTHPDPSKEPPEEICNPPEFIKRLTVSGIANEEIIDQNGFRQYFGCPDAIFSLKSIQNTA